LNEIFIAAGGTGGHIFPALSIAHHIAREYPVRFIGTKRGMEKNIIPEAGFPLSYIYARGWNRTSGIDFLRAFRDNIVGLFQSLFLFIRYRPRAVLAFGSYVSLLVAFWAKVFHIPVYIQEQNVRPGFANRIISRWSKQIFVSVAESVDYFKEKSKVVITGNPLREDIISWRGKGEEAKKRLGLIPHHKTILIMGGSRGSGLLNQVFWEILPSLGDLDVQVLHMTGSESFVEAQKMAKSVSFPYLVYDFYPNPGILYAAADVAIGRSGANTTYELFWFGLPAVLIPYGEATESHQLYNATWLQKQQPVVIIEEKNLRPETLERAIRDLAGMFLKDHGENEIFRFAAIRIAGMIVEEIRRRS
jgi:UDP-N-acetylglucosamine--N-acetylmuramyl-(pentapeptide) pyrophosphoryl-undecaprenol N-acetylglucosamine transferase